MLYYREAQRADQCARADRIEDVGAGFAGGKKVRTFVKRLRRGSR